MASAFVCATWIRKLETSNNRSASSQALRRVEASHHLSSQRKPRTKRVQVPGAEVIALDSDGDTPWLVPSGRRTILDVVLILRWLRPLLRLTQRLGTPGSGRNFSALRPLWRLQSISSTRNRPPGRQRKACELTFIFRYRISILE